MYQRIFFLLLAVATTAGADAVSGKLDAFSIGQRQDGASVLTSISVRGTDSLRIFGAAKLIPARIVHYQGGGGVCVIVTAGTDLAALDRSSLLGGALNEGLPNPGVLDKPEPGAQGPGVGVQFAAPVVNRSGIDVVLFEMHKGPGGGDPFHVAPLTPSEGLHGITITQYDVAPGHPSAVLLGPVDLYKSAKPLNSMQELAEVSLQPHSTQESGFSVIAAGIDLSDLGYTEGQQTDGLVFRSVAGQESFDPCAVVGLPEPLPENLLERVPVPKPPEPGPLLKAAFDGPLAGCDEIVFAQRVSGRDHWYGNFGHYCETESPYSSAALTIEGDMRYAFADGGRLCRMNLRTGELRVIFEDAQGGIRDPDIHYDAQKILFSYRRGGTKTFHLYEIAIDGSNLKQLTDGPDNDIEPIYTPDGSIVFCSSRCHRFVPCWRTQVATLYRCDGDGNNIRMLSNNAEQENTPWMLPDGRVLYMRWEYVDRNQLLYHHLWTVNPDGSDVMVYFGNQYPGYVMIDAKPIPGTGNVVASFSPEHGENEHMGRITVVDPRRGPDDMSMARMLTEGYFRDPYPLSEDLFLVANDAGIHILGTHGVAERIYTVPSPEPSAQCHEPRPLRPREREHIVPNKTILSKATGSLILSDVYRGRNMTGVERGSIKKLLVLEQLPKPVNCSGAQEPLTIGGTFTLQRILGTVPVEEDGSAYMEVPALRSIFFVALNEKDLAIKRMQSFVTVQPGEVTSCVGCHERRTQAPHARSANSLVAARRAPSPIAPFAGLPDVFDFPRDVQPIFDRHCVSCHNDDKTDGGINFSPDHTPYYSTAYWTVVAKGLVVDGRNKYGNQPPYTMGSVASPLMKYLDATHYDVALSHEEAAAIRLWIDSGTTYCGTYACLGSGMFPVNFPDETISRRCGECHKTDERPYRNVKEGVDYYRFGKQKFPQPLLDDLNDIILIRHLAYFEYGEPPHHQALCNLDKPDRSLFLLAPLAKSAGGLERCGKPVFADTQDPDYQEILGAINTAAQNLRDKKRFDMVGFRPNKFYIREMQFFGILPDPLPADAPVDVYATDQRYWSSFTYRP